MTRLPHAGAAFEAAPRALPSSILIPALEDVRNANVSMRPTRLNLDFRVPGPIGDAARFHVESDVFGAVPAIAILTSKVFDRWT